MEIDLSQPLPNQLEFYAARGKAIDAYAGVEAAMSRLLSALMETGDATAAVIFYKIANTSSRNQIIETLMQKKHRETYAHFWSGIPQTAHKRGMMHLIRDLDDLRNKLVHWHSVANITDDGVTHALTKPTFWTEDKEPLFVTVDEIMAFSIKADWVTRVLNSFVIFSTNETVFPEPLRTTWRGIFQQPCIYPPQDNHPIVPTSKEHPTLPQSFQG